MLIFPGNFIITAREAAGWPCRANRTLHPAAAGFKAAGQHVGLGTGCILLLWGLVMAESPVKVSLLVVVSILLDVVPILLDVVLSMLPAPVTPACSCPEAGGTP